jgi:hypothetical protein
VDTLSCGCSIQHVSRREKHHTTEFTFRMRRKKVSETAIQTLREQLPVWYSRRASALPPQQQTNLTTV